MHKAFITVILLSCGAAQATDCHTYAAALASMRMADQAVRASVQQAPSPTPRLGRAMEVVDTTHTRRMKGLLARCGWPVASRYGAQASADAWLLVQHADHDRAFQRHALRLLRRAVDAAEARGGDLAYLADRLAVAQGRPQPYGTQFVGFAQCKPILAPIDDRAAVNARRRSIAGMPSLEEYERMAGEHMAPPECRRAP